MNAKQEALHELSVAIAALKNQQCHYDLAEDDPMVLQIKLSELEEEFVLLQQANSN